MSSLLSTNGNRRSKVSTTTSSSKYPKPSSKSQSSHNWEWAILNQPATSPGIFAAALVAAPTAVERPPLGTLAPPPNGHCVDNGHWENGYRVFLPWSLPRSRVCHQFPNPVSCISFATLDRSWCS
jgi:hypothetical protein